MVGPLLDGKGGRALVRDTDAGAYDGDATYDRAIGPLLLMPSVWNAYAADADADGVLDPYDIDDAALAVGRMLCTGAEDLNRLPGWTAAVGRLHAGRACMPRPSSSPPITTGDEPVASGEQTSRIIGLTELAPLSIRGRPGKLLA